MAKPKKKITTCVTYRVARGSMFDSYDKTFDGIVGVEEIAKAAHERVVYFCFKKRTSWTVRVGERNFSRSSCTKDSVNYFLGGVVVPDPKDEKKKIIRTRHGLHWFFEEGKDIILAGY